MLALQKYGTLNQDFFYPRLQNYNCETSLNPGLKVFLIWDINDYYPDLSALRKALQRLKKQCFVVIQEKVSKANLWERGALQIN